MDAEFVRELFARFGPVSVKPHVRRRRHLVGRPDVRACVRRRHLSARRRCQSLPISSAKARSRSSIRAPRRRERSAARRALFGGCRSGFTTTPTNSRFGRSARLAIAERKKAQAAQTSEQAGEAAANKAASDEAKAADRARFRAEMPGSPPPRSSSRSMRRRASSVIFPSCSSR